MTYIKVRKSHIQGHEHPLGKYLSRLLAFAGKDFEVLGVSSLR